MQAASDGGEEDSDAGGAEWAPAAAAAAGSDEEMSDAASEDQDVLDELAAAGGERARLPRAVLAACPSDALLWVPGMYNVAKGFLFCLSPRHPQRMARE